MILSRIARKYVRVTVTATLADGSAAELDGVDAALLGPDGRPDAATVWTPATYADGVVSLLLAGPDADPAGALVVPADGAALWLRTVDYPETDVARIDRVIVA